MNKFPITFGTESYYTIDNQKIYSKIKAIELANGDMSRIEFNWMPDTWNAIDWTKEPLLSWDELVRIRCQQIRDKHKHIALWYSGGYDSQTILDAFIKNNILLDEILIYDRRDFFSDPEAAVSITNANLVKLQHYPNLRINVIRVKPDNLVNLYKKLGTDWIYHPGCSLKLGKTSRYFSTNVNGEFLKNIDLSDRADIMGVDKAKVLLRDNKWYGFCPDGSVVDFIGSKQENFYISSELPELHIKQCYMTIRWFESLNELNEDLVHDVQGRNRTLGGPHEKYYQAWNIGMGRSYLYHGHEVSKHGAAKLFHISNSELSPDAASYYKHIKNNDKQVYSIYTRGLLQARQFDTGTSGSLADRTLISKQYYIKDQAHLA